MAPEKKPNQPGDTDSLVSLDRRHLWHPFTSFDTWFDGNFGITVVSSGEGSVLRDTEGREYLDGNSSIWTNLHGHRHPRITGAIAAQLEKIAHSSLLGLTNELAPVLAARLAELMASLTGGSAAEWRVFLSDDGSTAIEAAVKIVFQYFRLSGDDKRTVFVSLAGGYHGDTVGAMSVGHSAVFHGAYKPLLFDTVESMAPYCYRCPYNKALPEKQDARAVRKCGWECVRDFENAVESAGPALAGYILEPRIQGAAGMIMHPEGFAEKTAAIVQSRGGKVILDEVMTGFFRTGAWFAFAKERVRPDLTALAKGLTGGYLPLAATVVDESIAAAFRGGADRTFYHGHSYSGNQLGCAAALASIDLLAEPGFAENLAGKIAKLRELSQVFWSHPNVGDVRQEGMVLAVELVEDFATRKPFDRAKRAGFFVCDAAREFGLLTRPIGDVLLLMPPYSTTDAQLEQMVDGLFRALCKIIPAQLGS